MDRRTIDQVSMPSHIIRSHCTHIIVMDIEDVEIGRVVFDSVVDLARGDLIAVFGDRASGLEFVFEICLW